MDGSEVRVVNSDVHAACALSRRRGSNSVVREEKKGVRSPLAGAQNLVSPEETCLPSPSTRAVQEIRATKTE